MIEKKIPDTDEDFTPLAESMTLVLPDGHVVEVENGDVDFLADDGKVVYTLTQWEFHNIAGHIAQKRLEELLAQMAKDRREADDSDD